MERDTEMLGRDDPDRVLFAKTLRKHREKRGLSREELAAEVHHSASTIANVETGYRAPTAEQARDFDEFFDTPGTFADLEGRLHGLPFSVGFRPFRDVEAECVVLKLYEPLLVPGVQQTEDYMRALFETHPGVTPGLVDERTAGRLARQGVLARESPPRVWCILDQYVLKREIGSRKTMAGQIRHLIDVARRPNVTIQVITDTTHCGLSGAFYLAETKSGQRVAYLETSADGSTTEEPDTVLDQETRFATLMTVALRARESLEFLERMLDEWTD
jgi:transcriptional regulator with XRE-family HTH domain